MSSSRTFVEALKEKYCDDSGNDDGILNENNFVVVFSRPKTRNSSSSDAELGYLTNVVLCSAFIDKAGIPSGGLSSLCPSVVDLDISSNALGNWKEVFFIFKHLPALKYVNLSRNPLGENNQEIATTCTDQTFGINNLVLNNTKVTWEQATALASLMPNLKELHLCQNGYKDIPASRDRLCESLPCLQCLRLNENELSRWEDIAKFAGLVHLHTLIVSDNPLLYIGPVTTKSAADKKLYTECESSCDMDASFILCTKDMARDGREPCRDGCEHTRVVHSDNNGEQLYAESNASSAGADVMKGEEAIEVLLGFNMQTVGESGKLELSESTEPCRLQDMISLKKHSDSNMSGGKVHIDNKKNECWKHSSGSRSDEGRFEDDMEDSSSENTVTMTISSFQSLSLLCVSNTKLGNWRDIDALRTYPKLSSLKIRNIPLLHDASAEDTRRLLVASLPNIKTLNGSEITPNDTVKSERHFVRYFRDKPVMPERYKELVCKYGELKPYSVVDIGHNFSEFAHLSFIYGGRCIHQEKVRIVESVGQLRRLCAKLVRKNVMFLKVYYLAKDIDGSKDIPAEQGSNLEELFLESLPMSRYDMKDGDEIHIDVQKRIQLRPKIGNGPPTCQ